VSRALALLVLVLALGAAGCTPDRELSDAELFSKYCSKCHGEDGRGDESLLEGGQEVVLLASRHLERGDRDFVRRRIEYGYGQMPGYLHKVEPETLQRLVELTMRLAREDTGHRAGEEQPGTERPDDRRPEDDDHGPTTSQSRLPEARSAR